MLDKSFPPYDSTDTACRRICRLDPTQTYCIGCYRTISEIQGWATLARETKLSIIKDLENRKKDKING